MMQLSVKYFEIFILLVFNGPKTYQIIDQVCDTFDCFPIPNPFEPEASLCRGKLSGIDLVDSDQ